MKKNRLDSEVVKRGLVLTKEEANALIMAGEIQVNGQIIYKSDKKVTESSQIEIKKRLPYVSRGAYKIKKAIEDFSVDVEGIKVLDIGISTGGFTDFLLKNGARTVVGVDVNIDQVDYNLKNLLLLPEIWVICLWLEYITINAQAKKYITAQSQQHQLKILPHPVGLEIYL